MNTPAERPDSISAIVRQHYPHLLWLIALDWVAVFLNFRRFGLYEDDWYYSVGPYVWGQTAWFRSLEEQVLHMAAGRPVQIAIAYACGSIGAAFSSIGVLYVLAFLQSVLAVALMYLALSWRFQPRFCVFATTLFVLSPLTSMRPFLNGSFSLYPAYALLFSAFLLFCRRRYVLAFAAAITLLLTYESLYMLFLGAPLLDREKRLRSRRTILHAAAWAVIVAAFFLLRLFVGETRAVGVVHGAGGLAAGILAHMAFNGLNVIVAYLHAAYLAAGTRSLEAIGYGVAVAAAVWTLGFGNTSRENIEKKPVGQKREIAETAALGAAFVLLGLALSYFVLPGRLLGQFVVMDRSTRVLAGAEFGMSILLAALWTGAAAACRSHGSARIVRVLCVAFVVVLFAYSLVIQEDYAAAWETERDLLAQTILLTPDIQPNSTIMVRLQYHDPRVFARANRVRAIGEETAMFAGVLQFLFQYGQQRPKIFFVFSDDWKRYLKLENDGLLHWTSTNVPHRWDLANPPVAPGRLLYLENTPAGRLRRINSSWQIGGAEVMQPCGLAGPGWSQFKPSPLFALVLPNVIPEAPAWAGCGKP